MLYLLPRFVPAMCAVYAMITIIRDTGLINRLGQLFGVNINLGMMYHASGIITMNLWFNIPFAAMMIAAGLGGIPDSIIEAASDVGAGKLTIFKTMIRMSLSRGIWMICMIRKSIGIKSCMISIWRMPFMRLRRKISLFTWSRRMKRCICRSTFRIVSPRLSLINSISRRGWIV